MTIETAPPPYTSATVTGKTASASSYEMEEEDDIFDFKFNDDAHTQPYLSLGLTPLSQLSPGDTGPPSSTGDSYFFPSMPPPVTPISSVFNMPSSAPGIPVDSPFQFESSGMVMPEANPVGSAESANVARRTGRRGKHETSTPSQGYAMKLEPLLEDDGFGTILNHDVESSSSSAEDPSSHLLLSPFDANDSKLPPHLRRKTGKRRRSGTRRKLEDEDDGWGDNEGIVMWNKSLKDDTPVKLSREDSSPRQEGRRLRQELREEELARQKETLRQKHLEDEKARLMIQEQRAARIAKDYGSTRQREVNVDQAICPLSSSGGRLVLQQAMRFEAQAQLMQDLNISASPVHMHTRQPSDTNYIVNTSNQFSVL